MKFSLMMALFLVAVSLPAFAQPYPATNTRTSVTTTWVLTRTPARNRFPRMTTVTNEDDADTLIVSERDTVGSHRIYISPALKSFTWLNYSDSLWRKTTSGSALSQVICPGAP